MNCRDFQHHITLLMYEELPEGARPQLDTHLRTCDNCRDVYESEKNMHSVLAEDTPGWDVPADLLVEARRGLADGLDRVDNKRSWWRIPAFSVVFTPMRMLESAALVAMGLALGVYFSNQQALVAPPVASNQVQENQISVIPRNSTISNLQVVNIDPASGQVELAGDVSQPLRFQGRADDPMVFELLIGALRDSNNPGSRLKAVEVLSQKRGDESIEEVLINAMLYDPDPGVRQKAVESLKPYANERHVLAAFMQALASDKVAGIRIEAIDALAISNPNDRELAKTIHEVSKTDPNEYIRNKSIQLVGTTQ
jgi:hypothetical protein